MKQVLGEAVPNVPKEEKYDLADQMRRACKSAPALIAEGYAKKNYKRNWQKYIDDAIGECNEMIHHLSVCLDIYPKHFDAKLLQELIEAYDIAGKQLYRLGESWGKSTHNTRPDQQPKTHPGPYNRYAKGMEVR